MLASMTCLRVPTHKVAVMQATMQCYCDACTSTGECKAVCLCLQPAPPSLCLSPSSLAASSWRWATTRRSAASREELREGLGGSSTCKGVVTGGALSAVGIPTDLHAQDYHNTLVFRYEVVCHGNDGGACSNAHLLARSSDVPSSTVRMNSALAAASSASRWDNSSCGHVRD
jgi:hypothetical protein